MDYLNILYFRTLLCYYIVNVRSVVTVKRKYMHELNIRLKFAITHIHLGIG